MKTTRCSPKGKLLITCAFVSWAVGVNLAGAAPGDNLAVRGTASQSSTGFGGAANRAIDGNTDGNYAGNSVTHNQPPEDGAWWEVDLGAMMRIDRICVWWRTDCCSERQDDFTLVVLDGSRAEVIRETYPGSPPLPVYCRDLSPIVTGRIVRLEARVPRIGDGSFSLAEVEVFEAPPAPPVNDAFTNATVLAGPSGTVTGSNVSASKETDADEPGIKGNSGGRSIWYRWTARTSGMVTFTTAGSRNLGGGAMDTLLAAYTGDSVGSLSPSLAEDDDVVPGVDVTSGITFSVVTGTEYRIAVDGYGGETGAVVLNWSYASAFNVSATVGGVGFSRGYRVKTVPGKDHFLGQAEFTLRRYDDFTGAVQTDPITVRLDYALLDTTDGSNVTLTASSVTFVKSMPSFDEVLFGVRTPADRAFSETFVVQPAPGVQLDPVHRLYELVVMISHVETAGQPALADHTRIGASQRLLDFNGDLFFGPIRTLFTSLANEPAEAGVFSAHVRSLLAVPGSSGYIAGQPLYTFAGVFVVDLLPNGDSRVVGPALAAVIAPPPPADKYEVGRVRYRRLATTLTEAGAQSALRVTLPTGLGWRGEPTSRKLFGTVDFPPVALDQSLNPIGPELVFPGPLWVCEESKPFWIEALDLRWQIALGNFVLSPAGPVRYVRLEEMSQLQTAQASGVLVNSDQGRKRSNDGYGSAFASVTSSQVNVRADANGHALLSVSVSLHPRPEGFQTHFPYDSFVQWFNGGDLQILDDQVQPVTSSLNGVMPVSLAYARDCPKETNCPYPKIGSMTLALNPHGQQLQFTVDGGLAGTGVPSANSLTWGWIASEQAFAQRATNFIDAAFHAPGIFLRGDQAAEQAPEDRPGVLLSTGVGNADRTRLDRYGTAAYAEGLGDYAGLNFRARPGTVPPSGGASTLAGRATGEYPLSSRSKYYARPGGVSGIHEALSFPGRLVLYGYPVNFDHFGLSYLDGENRESRTQGFIPVPLPSHFTNEFEELTFTCLGALKDAKVPASSTNKPLKYWQGKFDPLAIQFVNDTACDPTSGYLVLGVVTRVAHIDAPLYGRLGFTSNGTLITRADHVVSNVYSRLRVPNRFNLKGPSAESYTFNSVGDAYFNNWDDFKAEGNVGFVNLAGTLDVPFFEDLQTHLQTSANTNLPSAPIHLMGGWPSFGWEDPGGKNFFTDPLGFDERNRGFPNDVGVAQYRIGNAPSDRKYLVRARQHWLGVVPFDYPLSWSHSRRAFKSFAPEENEFLVLNIQHKVKYLSPENAELAFGIQYEGMPRVNLANIAFNAVDDLTGVSAALDKALTRPVREAINQGLKELDTLLGAQSHKFFAPIFDDLANPVRDSLYRKLRSAYDAGPPWPAKAEGILKSSLELPGSPLDPTLVDRLRGLVGSSTNVPGLLKRLNDSLIKAQTTLQQITNSLAKDSAGNRPKINGIITNVMNVIGFLEGQKQDPSQLIDLVEKANPTFDAVVLVSTQLVGTLVKERNELSNSGEFKRQLEDWITSEAFSWDGIAQDVAEDLFQFFSKPSDSVKSPFEEYTKAEFDQLFRQKLEDRFFASAATARLQEIFKDHFYDTDAAIREAIDLMFGQINETIQDLIAQRLAEVDKSINGFLGPINKVMGAGQINGYAQIKGDSLVGLRLDGRFQWKVPDNMEFSGYLQIRELDSDGTNACVRMGGKAAEVTVGARDVALAWISPKLRADVEGKFSFATAPFSPIGMGGSFRVTGPLEFSGFKITELGATMAFGRDENYLGAKARVKFQQYEFAGGIFFGKTCTMGPLLLIDPMVAESLPPAPLTGAYVYAEGWFPLNEVIGIPSSCFFNLRAGIGAGAFYFLAGAEKVPTYGGRMLLGLSGEVLCIVSVEGKVALVGVKSGGDLTFTGNGSVSGDIGKCPFCLGFSKSIGLRYRNGDWKLDF